MTIKIVEPLENLARFQGEPALERIRSEFLSAVDVPVWLELIEEYLVLESPKTRYAYPYFKPWSFAAAPGSGAHHAHIGGLALHVLQGLCNARALADAHETRGLPLRRSLLYTAILLHDTMKRFIYRFTDECCLEKAEDPFIGKREDHHSWLLRELHARGVDRELLLAVAAMHGLDDVSLQDGVRPLAVVNHYMSISGTGLTMASEEVSAEHVFGFLADSDWPWSGRAQQRCVAVAGPLARRLGVTEAYMRLYLGSRFGFEAVDAMVGTHGLEEATELLAERMA
ncbi:HD domain-containing protein [Desulfocurvibacter africanus]|uniref:HD domain-containing protein n=1 Tax=Desulfocurvibacter africanus TaxID=873 RepID=UPI0004274A21|nr:HD domain-containing protein [Desulfocurvibacter africanus]